MIILFHLFIIKWHPIDFLEHFISMPPFICQKWILFQNILQRHIKRDVQLHKIKPMKTNWIWVYMLNQWNARNECTSREMFELISCQCMLLTVVIKWIQRNVTIFWFVMEFSTVHNWYVETCTFSVKLCWQWKVYE